MCFQFIYSQVEMSWSIDELVFPQLRLSVMLLPVLQIGFAKVDFKCDN